MAKGRDCVVARTRHMQDIFCHVEQEVRRRKRDRDLDEVFVDDAAEPKNGDAAPCKAQRRPTRRQLEERPYNMACEAVEKLSRESITAVTTAAQQQQRQQGINSSSIVGNGGSGSGRNINNHNDSRNRVAQTMTAAESNENQKQAEVKCVHQHPNGRRNEMRKWMAIKASEPSAQPSLART